jgi:hypothetical protein
VFVVGGAAISWVLETISEIHHHIRRWKLCQTSTCSRAPTIDMSKCLVLLLIEPINIRTNCTKMMKMLSIDEQTSRRLESIMNDMMHTEKRNINYDDVINELIDVYQERLALSGENSGG